MKYDIQYFIDKFEAIPEEMWSEEYHWRPGEPQNAFGHCGVRVWRTPRPHLIWTDEAGYLEAYLSGRKNIYSIDEGLHPDYPQPTPKQRILAALRDKLKETK